MTDAKRGEPRRSETLGELIDHLQNLKEEHGEETEVHTRADSVLLPSVATTYEADEDQVVVH